MKIFVGYHFDSRDRWVEELVFPIIRAFGDEVVSGGKLQGDQPIPDAVKNKIQTADALIAFATRRGDPNPEGKYATHRWVTDELAVAVGQKIPFVEVREVGVDEQRGIAGDHQPIIYDEKERDKCLVDLVEMIGRWHQEGPVRIQLLPDECTQEIIPLLNNPELQCSYHVLVDDDEVHEFPAKIRPFGQGSLIVRANDVPRRANIQVRIKFEGKLWVSNFESTELLSIHLRREK
jgi:hypothetical protein